MPTPNIVTNINTAGHDASQNAGSGNGGGTGGNGSYRHNTNTVYTHHPDVKNYVDASWGFFKDAMQRADKDVDAKRTALKEALKAEIKSIADDTNEMHDAMLWKLYIPAAADDGGAPVNPMSNTAEFLNAHITRNAPAAGAGQPYTAAEQTELRSLIPQNRLAKIEEIKKAQDEYYEASKTRLDLLKALVKDDKDKKEKLDKETGEMGKNKENLDKATSEFVSCLGTFGRNGSHIFNLVTARRRAEYDTQLADWTQAMRNLVVPGHPTFQYFPNYDGWVSGDPRVVDLRAANETWRQLLTRFVSDIHPSPSAVWAANKQDLDDLKKKLQEKVDEPIPRKPYGEMIEPGEKWTIAEVKKQLEKAEKIKDKYITGEKERFKRLTPLLWKLSVCQGLCFPPCSSSTPFRLLDLFRASRLGMLFYFIVNMLFVVALYGLSYGGADGHWQPLYIALVTTPDEKSQILFSGRLCPYIGTDISTANVTDCTNTGLHPKQFDGIGEVPGLIRWQRQGFWLIWLLPIIYGLLALNDLFRFWLVWRYNTGRNLKKKQFFLTEWDQYQQKVFDVVQKAGKSDIDSQMNDRKEKVEAIMKETKASRCCGDRCPGFSELIGKCRMGRADSRVNAAIESIWEEKVSAEVKSINRAISQAWVFMPTVTFPPALGAFIVALTQLVIMSWILTIYIPTMQDLGEIVHKSNGTFTQGPWSQRILAAVIIRIMVDVYFAVGSIMYAMHDEFCSAVRANRRLDTGDLIKNTFVGWTGVEKSIEEYEKENGYRSKNINHETAARLLADAQVIVYRERFWGARYYNNSMDWVWRVVTGRAHDRRVEDVDIPPIWVAPDIGGEKLLWYTGADLLRSTRFYVFAGYTAKGRDRIGDNPENARWPKKFEVHRRGAPDL